PRAVPVLRRLQARQSTTGSLDRVNGQCSGPERGRRGGTRRRRSRAVLLVQSASDRSKNSRHGRSSYFLNFACPDFPSAVLMVNVIVAPAAMGFFASPFSEFSPW